MDAEDLVRRSLFASIFGFKKKSSSSSSSHPSSSSSSADRPGPSWASAPRPTERVGYAPSVSTVPPAQSARYAPHPTVTFTPGHHQQCPHPVGNALASVLGGLPLKTKQDIYREIVNECEEFERSTTASPLTDIGSSPTSPTPVTAPWTQHAAGAYDLTLTELTSNLSVADAYQIPTSQPANVTPPMEHPMPRYAAPRPLALQPHQGMFLGASSMHDGVHQVQHAGTHGTLIGAHQAHAGAKHHSVMPDIIPLSPDLTELTELDSMKKPDELAVTPIQQEAISKSVASMMSPNMSFEELVKIVVCAVKETTNKKETDPEAILRRKRQLNNEAAARYRKRQREDRMKRTEELDGLQERNELLKKTVDQMQNEIQELKKAVLETTYIEQKQHQH